MSANADLCRCLIGSVTDVQGSKMSAKADYFDLVFFENKMCKVPKCLLTQMLEVPQKILQRCARLQNVC